RPAGRLVPRRASLRHLKARAAHPTTQLSQVPGLLAIDMLDRREVIVDLLVQRPIESRLHEDEDPSREHADHDGEHRRMPQGETRCETRAGEHHLASLRRTNPPPRTVWSSFGSDGPSTFRLEHAQVAP